MATIPNLLESYTKVREPLMPQQQGETTSMLMRLLMGQQQQQFQQKQKAQQEAQTKANTAVAAYLSTMDSAAAEAQTGNPEAIKHYGALYQAGLERTPIGAAIQISTLGREGYKAAHSPEARRLTMPAVTQTGEFGIQQKVRDIVALTRGTARRETEARIAAGEATMFNESMELIPAPIGTSYLDVATKEQEKEYRENEQDSAAINFMLAADYRHMVEKTKAGQTEEGIAFLEGNESVLGKSGKSLGDVFTAYMGHGNRIVKNAELADMWKIITGGYADEGEKNAIMAFLREGNAIDLRDPRTQEKVEVPSPFYFLAKYHLGADLKEKESLLQKIKGLFRGRVSEEFLSALPRSGKSKSTKKESTRVEPAKPLPAYEMAKYVLEHNLTGNLSEKEIRALQTVYRIGE